MNTECGFCGDYEKEILKLEQRIEDLESKLGKACLSSIKMQLFRDYYIMDYYKVRGHFPDEGFIDKILKLKGEN